MPQTTEESDLLSYIANEYVSDKRSEPMNPNSSRSIWTYLKIIMKNSHDIT